jgi:hypothetical protein
MSYSPDPDYCAHGIERGGACDRCRHQWDKAPVVVSAGSQADFVERLRLAIEGLEKRPEDGRSKVVSGYDEGFNDALDRVLTVAAELHASVPSARQRSDGVPDAGKVAVDAVDEGAAKRLRRVLRLLDIESAVPADDTEMMGALFSVLGIVARRIEILVVPCDEPAEASRQAPAP